MTVSRENSKISSKPGNESTAVKYLTCVDIPFHPQTPHLAVGRPFSLVCPQALSNVTDDYRTYAIGYLHLTLTQGGFSLTELTDINPIDLATLLGNIGGFWGKITSL